jgi:peptidyl-prolyl cis-trans isomerase SurA
MNDLMGRMKAVRGNSMLTGLSGAAMVLAMVFALPASQARAQALVATVNDSPVTTYDLEQRMKLLRVLRANATREAALESIVEDRLKLGEITKYGLRPTEQDAAAELGRIAAERKIPAGALGGSLQAAGVSAGHWQEHGRAQVGWRGLVGAINKGVGVSEVEVRQELEKRRGKGDSAEYRLTQVILVVPGSAGPGVAEQRAREAENLRSRFNDCQSGLQLARTLKDVAVKAQFSRSGSSLSPELAEVLQRTPVGRLTPPQRGATGVEMIAVCGKGAESSDGQAAQEIRQTLLAKKLKVEEEKMYAPVRKRAVVVRR